MHFWPPVQTGISIFFLFRVNQLESSCVCDSLPAQIKQCSLDYSFKSSFIGRCHNWEEGYVSLLCFTSLYLAVWIRCTQGWQMCVFSLSGPALPARRPLLNSSSINVLLFLLIVAICRRSPSKVCPSVMSPYAAHRGSISPQKIVWIPRRIHAWNCDFFSISGSGVIPAQLIIKQSTEARSRVFLRCKLHKFTI